MTTPWDVGFMTRWRPPEPRRMDVLWRVTKDARIAEARVSPHLLGVELYFFVNDQLLDARVFRQGELNALGELMRMKRREFEERGWT